MKKIIMATVLAGFIILTMALILASPDYDKKCVDKCMRNNTESRKQCNSDFVTEMKTCISDYKLCMNGTKGLNSTIARTEKNQCRKQMWNCIKTAENDRKECTRNITQSCKDFCSLQKIPQCSNEDCNAAPNNKNGTSCPMVYFPVCGKDGKTYGNECVMKLKGAEKDYDGACRNETICPTLYQPVCGKDNKTYPNECVMKLKGVEKAYDGECIVKDENKPSCKVCTGSRCIGIK